MYGIYDMKESEQCVAIFKTRKEVAKFFDTTSNSIGTSITRKHKRKYRFLIEKIKEREDN